jgi:hypothetical protein
LGLLQNKFNEFGPDSESGELSENPSKETRRQPTIGLGEITVKPPYIEATHPKGRST